MTELIRASGSSAELALIGAMVLVAANGCFVGAEFAIARLRPTQAADFVRDREPGGKSLQHAVQHIDSYLSACQLGITLASLGLGAVGQPAFHDLLEPVFDEDAAILGLGLVTLVAFSIISVAHVVLGELAPESAAISRTSPIALLLAPPLRVFNYATKPLVDGFNFLGNLVLRPFGIPRRRRPATPRTPKRSCACCCARAAKEGSAPVRSNACPTRRSSSATCAPAW